ncbi:MAG TPA: DUF2207 domain-containing protein [Xanthomonadaceae bacterium]|nr:DUF2207 domain-containing protein [Xanthomonadaceae bacterium]
MIPHIAVARALRCMAAVLALAAAGGVPAAEVVERFHADIVIHADGSLDVTETIAVRAEGREIRRGIIREFPTRYEDRFGNLVQVDFRMIEALRDGRPEPFWTERVSNGIEIFLGDDSFLEVPRTHTYALRYRTTRQLGFFDGFDELYWNVTGTGWIFPIQSAGATVRLPDAVPAASLRLACYTGPQDAEGRDCRHEVPEPGVIDFESNRRFRAREGLTIAVGFPKGMVVEPTAADRVGWVLQDNRGLLVAAAGLLLLFGWYLLQWHRKGRDPSPGVVFPRYQPPQGHSPGGIRYLRRMGWDNRCFTADLVDSAVRGSLVIHRDRPTRESIIAGLPEAMRSKAESSRFVQRAVDMALKVTKEQWRLERVVGAPETTLADPQRALTGKLFAGATSIPLTNSQPATVSAMQAARSAHQSGLAGVYTPRYFVNNSGVVGAGCLLSILYLALAFWIADGFGIPGIIAIAVISVVLHIVFGNLMKRPTAEGRKLLDEIEGLRKYLGVAEKDELGRMQGPGAEPPLDAERYEALLPYALALEVEEAWTGKFTLAVGAAAAAAVATGSHWYRGNLASIGSLGDMSKGLGSALSSSIASSSSPPGSSSGSGGGGRSGGGGGGGGGRGR